MKKKLFALLIMTAIVLSLTACGQAPASTPAETAANDAPQAEDGQNPVMNVIGIYHADESESIEALVEADGTENAKITVTYAGSPWFRNITVMSGRFDTETFTVEFENATLTEYTYNSDGSVNTETVSYTDGKGRAVFHPESSTLTITEDFESAPIVTAFSWGPASNMMTVTDPQHYAGVTAMDKYQVEGVVGFNVRTWYLSENWYAMADMIRYPITINGTELADSVAFINYILNRWKNFLKMLCRLVPGETLWAMVMKLKKALLMQCRFLKKPRQKNSYVNIRNSARNLPIYTMLP